MRGVVTCLAVTCAALFAAGCSTARARDLDYRCKTVQGKPYAFKVDENTGAKRADELSHACTELSDPSPFRTYVVYCCANE